MLVDRASINEAYNQMENYKKDDFVDTILRPFFDWMSQCYDVVEGRMERNPGKKAGDLFIRQEMKTLEISVGDMWDQIEDSQLGLNDKVVLGRLVIASGREIDVHIA